MPGSAARDPWRHRGHGRVTEVGEEPIEPARVGARSRRRGRRPGGWRPGRGRWCALRRGPRRWSWRTTVTGAPSGVAAAAVTARGDASSTTTTPATGPTEASSSGGRAAAHRDDDGDVALGERGGRRDGPGPVGVGQSGVEEAASERGRPRTGGDRFPRPEPVDQGGPGRAEPEQAQRRAPDEDGAVAAAASGAVGVEVEPGRARRSESTVTGGGRRRRW